MYTIPRIIFTNIYSFKRFLPVLKHKLSLHSYIHLYTKNMLRRSHDAMSFQQSANDKLLILEIVQACSGMQYINFSTY